MSFKVKTLQYAGNGTSQAIATPFPLDVGKVWMYVQDLITNQPVVKSTTMAANQSKISGSQPGTFKTTGITAFTSTGFTVGNDNAVNQSGHTYNALILQDTGGNYMNVGTYVGTAVAHNITGVGFDPIDVIVWTRQPFWRSSLMPANQSMQLTNNGGTNVDNEINALITDGFTVGLSFNSDVNGNGFTYHWVAFSAAAALVAMKHFSVAGSGSIVDTGSIGFTPEWAFAKAHTSATGGFNRGPAHTGTNSSELTDIASQTALGIRALNADTITLGTAISVSGKTAHGFAFKTFLGSSFNALNITP